MNSTYEEWAAGVKQIQPEHKADAETIQIMLADWTADRAALLGLVRELRDAAAPIVAGENITGAEEYVVVSLTHEEWRAIRDALARADKVLAGVPGEGGERSYSAAEVQVLQTRAWKEGVIAHRRGLRLSDGELTTEAARLYPEKPQEGKE